MDLREILMESLMELQNNLKAKSNPIGYVKGLIEGFEPEVSKFEELAEKKVEAVAEIRFKFKKDDEKAESFNNICGCDLDIFGREPFEIYVKHQINARREILAFLKSKLIELETTAKTAEPQVTALQK